MHSYEHEGAAWKLLTSLGLDGHIAPSVLAVAHCLGLRLMPGASPCVQGLLWRDQGMIFFDDRAPRQVSLAHIAHELGHHAARGWSDGERASEREIDAVADALQMPGVGMRRLVRAVGWDAEAWQRSYPDVAPGRIFRRAAQALEGVVVLREGMRREVHRHERVELVDALCAEDARERALYREVLRTGEPALGRDGVSAWPYRDPGARRGVVILGPLSAWLGDQALSA